MIMVLLFVFDVPASEAAQQQGALHGYLHALDAGHVWLAGGPQLPVLARPRPAPGPEVLRQHEEVEGEGGAL